MNIIQKQTEFPFTIDNRGNFSKLQQQFPTDITRFAIVNSENGSINCEYAEVDKSDMYKNIFEFNPRKYVNNSNFNAVMVVPTGIGAEVGGDSGDANVAARLIGSSVDTLITHPNVVNAADFNEMTPNTLYVEGSILNRFLMGTIGLAPSRGNRILVIMDTPKKDYIKNYTINQASAARVTLGCDVDVIEVNDPPKYSFYFNENRMAVGKTTNFEKLLNVVEKYKGQYDSFVLHTITDGDNSIFGDYFNDKFDINPWGGIEAMITHTLSNLLDVSVAHAPLFDDYEDFNFHFPIVNPQKSPETLSKTELFCVIKGMYKTPKIVEPINVSGVLTNSDVHALVIPDRCIGIPVLAALEQNIPVIAVDDNRNLMKNDLSKLPWKRNQFFRAKNYLEASGLLTALKNGLSPNSLKRPIDFTTIL